jgi:hypothetical protein
MMKVLAILAAAILMSGLAASSDAAPTSATTGASSSQLFSYESPARSPAFLVSIGITTPDAATAQQRCCKICTTGKACGNTCISRDKTCHVGPGCACDG